MTSILLRSTLLLLACSSVSASPTGASACPGGEAAVGGTHLTAADLKTGTLEESPQGLKVQLNGADLVPGIPGIFFGGEEATISLTGTADFKGFLLRLDGAVFDAADVTYGFDPSEEDEIQQAAVCTGGAEGWTHTNNSPKSTVSVSITLGAARSDLRLDVTVVISNSAGVSEYYYTGYDLSAPARADWEGDGDLLAAGDPNATAPAAPTDSEPGNGTTAAPDSSSTTAPDSSSTTAPDASAASILTTGWVTTFIGGLFAMVM
ncbi:expressed unknown protein [Seminavis robusta]|uniref:Uncharacterized protein n=1 Tax=Seminavis robusta TaxID=568900 RepID=A0A9N8DKL4_9STRA|nr:expressed unknown protein [Seminavis robusta]|eukprot:Sro173_g076420.1 n/a (263) ;mRNA; f:74521-75309